MWLTEAFALVGGTVDEHFAADDVAEGEEHLHELSIAKLLRQVVDEQVAALGARYGTPWETVHYILINIASSRAVGCGRSL